MKPAVTALSSLPIWAGATPAGWRVASSWSMRSPTSWAIRCWWGGEIIQITSTWWVWAWATASDPAAWSPWYVQQPHEGLTTAEMFYRQTDCTERPCSVTRNDTILYVGLQCKQLATHLEPNVCSFLYYCCYDLRKKKRSKSCFMSRRLACEGISANVPEFQY